MAAEDGAEHRIKLLVEKLQRGDSDDIYVTRAEIAARIKQVAEWVCLFLQRNAATVLVENAFG